MGIMNKKMKKKLTWGISNNGKPPLLHFLKYPSSKIVTICNTTCRYTGIFCLVLYMSIGCMQLKEQLHLTSLDERENLFELLVK